jgi:hypothetical protein
VGENLLSLPVQIQIALASGYAAYMAANTGIRGHHSATDVTFGALAYGLIATGIMALMPRGSNIVVSGFLAFGLTVFSGLFWRKIGCRVWMSALRALGVSWADDSPSAWMALGTNTQHYVTQIAVQLDNGTWLRCDDTSKFGNAPFGPCVLGPRGDVALYLTHEEREGEAARELSSVVNKEYGTRMTYVPAERVRRITIRHLPIN